MKKALVILLVFLILTNFHCVRFNVQTVDTNHKISSCPATLLDTTEESLVQKNGTLVLSENAVLFMYKDAITEIPYSQIESLDFYQMVPSPFPGPAAPPFDQEGKTMEGAGLTTALVIGFFSIALLLWLLYGAGSKYRSSVQLDIYFTSNNKSEMTTFKMKRESLAKIYPLLLEKIYQ
jgi:hypothetical protein